LQVDVGDVELLAQVHRWVEFAHVLLPERLALDVVDAVVEGPERVADLLDVAVAHVDVDLRLDVERPGDVDVAAQLPVAVGRGDRGPGRNSQREGHRQHVVLLGLPRALTGQAAIPHVAVLGALLVVLDQLDEDRRDGLAVGRGELEEPVDGVVVGEGVAGQGDQQGPVVVGSLAAAGQLGRGRPLGPADADGRRHADAHARLRLRGLVSGRRSDRRRGLLLRVAHRLPGRGRVAHRLPGRGRVAHRLRGRGREGHRLPGHRAARRTRLRRQQLATLSHHRHQLGRQRGHHRGRLAAAGSGPLDAERRVADVHDLPGSELARMRPQRLSGHPGRVRGAEVADEHRLALQEHLGVAPRHALVVNPELAALLVATDHHAGVGRADLPRQVSKLQLDGHGPRAPPWRGYNPPARAVYQSRSRSRTTTTTPDLLPSAMPLRRYGVLKARPTNARQGGGRSPHYHIHAVDHGEDYRISISVRSKPGPSRVLYRIDDRFDHPLLSRLRDLPMGFCGLASEPDGVALDYVRGQLLRREDMHELAWDVPGPDNDF